jgi:hypothetical protein
MMMTMTMMMTISPDPTLPARPTADLWGVPFDGGTEIPTFAQSARVASVAATALYVELEGRGPTTVGTPRLWNAFDVAQFVSDVDAKLQRHAWEGGTPPPLLLIELRNVLIRPAGDGHTWQVAPPAAPSLRQVEPYLWRNLIDHRHTPLIIGNAMRLFGWVLLLTWPLFVKAVWAYGHYKWGWPIEIKYAGPFTVFGAAWFILILAETRDWALWQFSINSADG